VPSDAKERFEANAADVGHLLDIHSLIGGADPGRRSDALQVLNRSGIVLVCAVWEAYCEDLAGEALKHVVASTDDPTVLPLALRKSVAAELKGSPHDLSPWDLAAGNWKQYLEKRLKDLETKRNRRLNAPHSKNIDDLFADAVGVTNVSGSWRWPGITVERSRKKLNDYIELRGTIAHRGTATVQKDLVEDFLNHVKRLAGKTDARVSSFVGDATGTPLYE
jgi:hypothetical protein